METVILIEIRGGNIQNIIASSDIKVKILDHDNLESGDEIETSFYEADSIQTAEEIDEYFETELKKYQK